MKKRYFAAAVLVAFGDMYLVEVGNLKRAIGAHGIGTMRVFDTTPPCFEPGYEETKCLVWTSEGIDYYVTRVADTAFYVEKHPAGNKGNCIGGRIVEVGIRL